ncbi:hypothetical protein [Herbaspirillum sp. 3R-11]|uniref:hypothetical protein n=1 Tax=Herbaspirillum sp. 3R-11 TaxID=2559616 RepID=UPI001072DE60|nr:hypothetical protein [Herbaspirillum sp. 3R-11]TFI11247.1 hypothetical protein E4P32_07145 [Herbaspirillum sp. 3R11]
MMEPSDFRKEHLQREITNRFGTVPILLRVNVVADILGIPARRLYDQIRGGTFFLPFRLIHRSPMVSTEDFIGWYVTSIIEPKTNLVTNGSSEEKREAVPLSAPKSLPRHRNFLRRMMDDELLAIREQGTVRRHRAVP